MSVPFALVQLSLYLPFCTSINFSQRRIEHSCSFNSTWRIPFQRVDRLSGANVATDIQVPMPTEAVPAIPAYLQGQECLYGYVAPDELLEAYHVARDPYEQPATYHLRRAYKYHPITITQLSRKLGFKMLIDAKQLEGSEDIAWFSYPKSGVVRVTQVLTESIREQFEKQSGVTQWLEAFTKPPVIVKD
ncbi:hypothetical protein DFH09DRAFT_457691 [Mycena vulgaris]|nr:hypothetical protein DFH09DRAFT_457691 [Mycena vulgaris]